MTPIQQGHFIDDYRDLCSNSNLSDLERAGFSEKLAHVLPDRNKFVLFCMKTLEMSSAGASKHWAMAKAFRLHSSVQMWRGVGWAGMRLYAQVKQEDNRKKIETQIGTLYQGNALKKSQWLPVFKKIVPDVVAVNSKTSKKTASNTDAEAQAALLAKVVRRLVESAPILLRTLSAKEKAAAGLGAKVAQKVAG